MNRDEMIIYDASIEAAVLSDLALDSNPTAVYLASLTSANSRRTMTNGLRTILGVVAPGRDGLDVLTFPFWSLDYQHVTAVKSRMIELKYSPAKINAALSALRGVIKQGYKLGHITAEQYHRVSDVENVKTGAIEAAAGRQIGADEIKRILAACDDGSIEGVRDAAIIALGLRAGLRRSEIAGLDLKDYNRSTGRLTIKQSKGGKSRTVYVDNTPKRLLDAWIDARGNRPGKLFGRILRGASDTTGLTAQSIMNVLSKRAKQAGIEEHLSPHDMRRTFIGDALDAGIDLATVADLAGHSSTDTTRRYDRRGEKRKSEAAKKLDL